MYYQILIVSINQIEKFNLNTNGKIIYIVDGETEKK